MHDDPDLPGGPLRFGRLLVPRFTLEELTIAGPKVTMAGILFGDADATAMTLRDMALGYGAHNADEEVVPVVVDQDPRLSGFYLVEDVGYRPLSIGLSDDTVGQPIGLDLLRVGHSGLFEVLTMGDTRNVITITAPTNTEWIAVPGDSIVSTAGFSRADEGTTQVAPVGGKLFETTDVDLALAITRFRVGPADFYNGAVTIETTVDGGDSWQTLIGRDVPDAPNGWRISNGLVRFTHLDDTGSDFIGEAWTAAAGWLNLGEFEFTHSSSPVVDLEEFASISVSRNDGAVGTIRLWHRGGFVTGANGYLEISLARGGRGIEVFVTGLTTLPFAWGVHRTATDAGTTLTTTGGNYGQVATSATSGYRWVLMAKEPITALSGTPTGIRISTTRTSTWLGVYLWPTTGSAAGDGAAAAAQFYAAMDFVQQAIRGG